MNITTDRLTIRRIAAEDWESMKAIWDDQKCSAYARFDKPNDTAPGAVRERIQKWASFAYSMEHIFLAVCLEKALIGYVAFNRRESGYEIGYCFHSDYHGKGYAKESMTAMIQAIHGMQPDAVITAGTAIENTPSVKLLQSLGFRRIGTERVSFYKDSRGEPVCFDGGIFELSACARTVDAEIRLIPYYRNDEVSLAWYQDPDVCKQVDNRDKPYDLGLLHGMYDYLCAHGACYYIEYRGALVGDVSLRDNGEIAIVICKAYQNRHIGRRCVGEMIRLAGEKGMDAVSANIYAFNAQSRKMFEAVGFYETDSEWFRFDLR